MKINVVINDNGFTVPFAALKLVLLVINSLRRAERCGFENCCATENIYPVPEMPESNAGAFKIQAIKIVRSMPDQNYSLCDSKNIVEFAIEHEYAIERLAELC